MGEPPAPRAYHVPRQPGPDLSAGIARQVARRLLDAAAVPGAYWVAPYHVGGLYYAGRWEGSRWNIAHDHHWDRDKQRDEHRDLTPTIATTATAKRED
jgi:hypothetical protein